MELLFHYARRFRTLVDVYPSITENTATYQCRTDHSRLVNSSECDMDWMALNEAILEMAKIDSKLACLASLWLLKHLHESALQDTGNGVANEVHFHCADLIETILRSLPTSLSKLEQATVGQ